MKADWVGTGVVVIRRSSIAILLLLTLLVSACGGSGSADLQPAAGAAQPDQTPSSEIPGSGNTDTGNEVPENPGAEVPATETPVTDNADENPETTPEVSEGVPEATPESPTPESPQAGNETAATERVSALALSGSVASYPNDSSAVVASDDSQGLLQFDEATGSQTLGRADMRPVQALVSLFVLADVDYQTPVATVKTDATGNYSVTANDVRDYLLQQALITDTASEDEIIDRFRALGRLQVRAVIVRERNGVRKAMAIQSIADPADVDESGLPKPVAVDPIAHRVVKHIIDSIRESVASLESMGLSANVVDQLIRSVVTEVVAQIDQVLEETADEVIEIPDGLTLDDVIETQEDELELQVEPDQLEQLAVALDGSDAVTEDTQLEALETVVAVAGEVLNREESTLGSSLNSESQGLLSGFENVLNEQLTGSVEETINDAREAGTEEALAEVFGDRTDGVALEQALAAVDAEKDKQLRQSIRRFFLSLGLGVVIEENATGDAGIVALRLPLPYHLDNASLPGVAGLGEREIRLFKVGPGQLDADSDYTADPFAQLGVAGAEGLPQAPFKYVLALQDVSTRLLQGMSTDDAQLAVNESIESVLQGGQPAADDYRLLDSIEVLHELRERLRDTTLVSAAVIDTLVENRDREIPLKRIAATIAAEFEWVAEDVQLTPEGFAISSNRRGPLAGGANAVDSSELVRLLSLTLGQSPIEAARQLTEQTRFVAQFAPRAIELALQNTVFDDQTSLTDALLDIYPPDPSGYRDMVTGSSTGQPEPDYIRARDRVARGLTAALPARLFGQTLTSDSVVNIRSALFFLDFVLRGEYLIDPSRGFYTEFPITRDDGVIETRFVPDYANVKSLEPIGDVSVAALMSELLNVTDIDDGSLFTVAVEELRNSLPNIPSIPDYQEHSVDEFIDELGPRNDLVDATCTVEMFDGSDPDSGEDHQRLQLSVYDVEYIATTGDRLKSQRLDVSITSELREDNDRLYRTYRISGLPTRTDNGHGRDYVLRFDIDGYQNELPELHLYADGFVPEINLCDVQSPLFIGPDQSFFKIPGVGLVSDQSRAFFDVSPEQGTVPTDPVGDYEWIDLSNFEVPGAPLYLTDVEESEGLGAGDLRLQSGAAGFSLTGPDNSDVGFARLYGVYVDGELQLSLQPSEGQSLYGLNAAVGANARVLLESISSGQVELAQSVLVYTHAPSLFDSVTDSTADRDLQNDPALDGTVPSSLSGDGETQRHYEPESLYLLRDREGRFWVLELRYIDLFIEADGIQRAFVDLGVASINNIGLIDVPKLAYDSAIPVEPDGTGEGVIEYHNLYYGDWLVLQKPTNYVGAQLLPSEVLAFNVSDDYNNLRQATDGVFIRYAGDHFAENVASIEDLETRFGSPPDFSSVPVRLEAGRDGLTFVTLAFDKTEKRYVMDPLPQDAARYTARLSHNDLVAIFDDRSDSDGPVYLARVIRDFPANDPSANGQIGMEVLRYDNLNRDFADYDEREVVCFTEDRGACPEIYPALYSIGDAVNAIGVVYDNDVDGLPFLFDPNDFDPNIPGFINDGLSDGDNSVYLHNDELTIEAVAGVSDDGTTVRALIASTNSIYPGDIESITLESALFGVDTGEQLVLTCDAPGLQEFAAVSGVSCQPHSVGVEAGVVSGLAVDSAFGIATGVASGLASSVDVEIYRQSEHQISLLLLAAPETLESLGSYVDFSYRINFRPPTGIDGEALFCGETQCSGRTTSQGAITVPLGRDIPVHRQVTILVDGDDPQDLLGLRELDVDRELTVSAAALPGAVEYELALFCPSTGSNPDPAVGEFYQPEEHLRFFEPSTDQEGRSVAPVFAIQVPWLAGRECQISLRSRIETDAGDSAGVSLYVQGGVRLKGSVGPEFIDNETVLKEGDSVCVDGETRLTTVNCTTENALFDVQSLVGLSELSGLATFNLGDDVVTAYAEQPNKDLLQARLEANAVISFDGIQDGLSASCGEIILPGDSINSCGIGAGDLSSAFVVSSDGAELWSLLTDAIIEGPLNEQGNISLTEPGYYAVIRFAEDLASADGSVTSAPVEELMTIHIDVYDTEQGEQAVYARFERVGDSDFYQLDSNSNRQLTASAPGYIFMRTVQGHEIDIDTRALVDDELRLSFFVFKPQQLAGMHDLNGDGINDIEVSFDNGLWSFRFDPSVDDVRDPGVAEAQQYIPVDAAGFRVATFGTNQGYAEMMVRIADTEFLVIAELGEEGAGMLEIIDQFDVDSASVGGVVQ